MFEHILITGGAGFIGSHIAFHLRNVWPDSRITVLDDLSRKGSLLNVPRLQVAGIRFLEGDVRVWSHIEQVGPFNLLIDCAAEPSVHAGTTSSPRDVIDINLSGSINVFEKARVFGAAILFLSTSRIYPIQPLNNVCFDETETRYQLSTQQDMPGVSECGISESFTCEGARSFYGATKLSAELLLAEYAFNYQVPVLINRCGLVAGAWQMGRVDQGILAYWLAAYVYHKPLQYTGFMGKGKQVRDVLSIDDLCDLVVLQLQNYKQWNGSIYNVGGGMDNSLSIFELNQICEDLTGQRPEISTKTETSPLDVRIYVSDNSRVIAKYDWHPQIDVRKVILSMYDWFLTHKNELAPVFQGK